MASRAKFETDQGILAFSRGTLTLRSRETGTTRTYTTVGEQFAPSELLKWNSKNLSVEVYTSNGGVSTLDFDVLKTPQETREAGLKAFAPAERTRLLGVITDCQGIESLVTREKKVKEAQEVLAAFEKRYARLLPKTEKKSNKKPRKTETKKEKS